MTEKGGLGQETEAKEEFTQSDLPSSPEPRQLEYHPAADIFPLLEGEEFFELVADIKNNGLQQPIVRYQNKILDGRNRERACRAAGVQPRFTDLHEVADPFAYAISANIKRRHLNSVQKRELATEILQMDPTNSDRQIAKQIGASQPTITAVRRELETNCKIFAVEKTVGADGKVRKRPAKRSEQKKRQVATEDIGLQSFGENERKIARLDELEPR